MRDNNHEEDVKEDKRERPYLNRRQRVILAEKMADLANIAVGSLIFGYVLNSARFNQFSLVIGFLIAGSAYVIALKLEK